MVAPKIELKRIQAEKIIAKENANEIRKLVGGN